VAGPEYIDYVRPKLLPHKLSFDSHSNSSTSPWDTSQATQYERPLHQVIIDVQPSVTFSSTSSSQLQTLNHRDLFVEHTTCEDYRSSYRTASVDEEIPDCRNEDNVEARTECRDICNNAMLPVSMDSSGMSDTLPIHDNSNMPLDDIVNEVAETRDTDQPYEHPFQADSAIDLRPCSTYCDLRSSRSAVTGSIASEMSNHHTSHEHSRSDNQFLYGVSSSARDTRILGNSMMVRDEDLDLPSVTTLPDPMYENEALVIPVAFNSDRLAGILMSGLNRPSLPSYVGSASISPLSPNFSLLVEYNLL
jgi:hypothetical protein